MIENFLKEYGYNDIQVKRILNSKSLQTFTKETLLNKIKSTNSFFEKMNITKENVIKMTSKYPQIYGYSIEIMIAKINYLINTLVSYFFK